MTCGRHSGDRDEVIYFIHQGTITIFMLLLKHALICKNCCITYNSQLQSVSIGSSPSHLNKWRPIGCDVYWQVNLLCKEKSVISCLHLGNTFMYCRICMYLISGWQLHPYSCMYLISGWRLHPYNSTYLISGWLPHLYSCMYLSSGWRPHPYSYMYLISGWRPHPYSCMYLSSGWRPHPYSS